jgi:hypothetical protein
MAISPYRPSLYRSTRRGITCLVLICTAGLVFAQFARKNTISKGPRAVGLLVMNPKGKPRLIPIAIMVDGRFYDAGAYKASPVPMALDVGTVYEAERTGNSLGLFTVKQVLQQKNKFIAEGTFLKEGETPPSTGKKAESKPREGEEDKPPVLRRSASESTKATPPPAESKPATPATTVPPAEPSTTENTKNPAGSAVAATPGSADSAPEDANRPVLKRGIPPKTSSSNEPPAPRPAPKKPPQTVPQPSNDIVPAISDADGPEPKPFTYDIKAEEELTFRSKMLAIAADELRRYAKVPAPSASANRIGNKLPTKKPPEPAFNDIQLHVFDISLSNEPVLILSATANLPETPKDAPKRDYFLTLVARSDINGDLRKLMSVVTDPDHLDVSPRMELIDAVDADGDGRAELLFRQTSDAGIAYAIYRVHPDQLYSIYEGTAE